ncbi:hypothetical protein HMPREF0880_00856 [Yokenella regensburgei ATCC 43003]|nr:hypothetical protein HMPREF0880_00856 [Yokenella regensburgei ATCC 43003]
MVLLPLVLPALALTEPRLILEPEPAVTVQDFRTVISTWNVPFATAALADGIKAAAMQESIKRARMTGFISLTFLKINAIFRREIS